MQTVCVGLGCAIFSLCSEINPQNFPGALAAKCPSTPYPALVAVARVPLNCPLYTDIEYEASLFVVNQKSRTKRYLAIYPKNCDKTGGNQTGREKKLKARQKKLNDGAKFLSIFKFLEFFSV